MSTQMRGSNFYTSSPGLNKQRNSKQVNANVESNSPFLENENKHENIESEFYGGTDNQGGYNLQELSGRPVQSSYIPEQFYQNSGQQPGQPQPIPISGKEQPIAGQNQSVIEPIDKTKLLKEDLNVFINIFKGNFLEEILRLFIKKTKLFYIYRVRGKTRQRNRGS